MAFGWLDEDMVAALNESCHNRAEVKKGSGLASTQETTFARLSAINRAKELGNAPPPVEGLTKTISLAAQLRQDAKEMEEEVQSYEDEERLEWKRAQRKHFGWAPFLSPARLRPIYCFPASFHPVTAGTPHFFK